MHFKRTKFVALCPGCENPFHYRECKYIGGENDTGWWKVLCQGCEDTFLVRLTNPIESSTSLGWQVLEKFDTHPGDNTPTATSVVMHDFPDSKIDLKFNRESTPLYQCTVCGEALDELAYQFLEKERGPLQSSWLKAENYLLAANGPSSDTILVSLDLLCTCGGINSAIFNARTNLGASAIPLIDRCQLVHVENSALEKRLNCLASKSEIMDLLEKLLIRWHTVCDQIFLATPFVGHQWMGKSDVQVIWEWLFKNLDPERATLLTRRATWKSFKDFKRESGIGFDELERYGLQDKVVSAGATKQDFHAKFFAGISKDMVEVLSGSANLLRGPSIENISFKRMSIEDFEEKYIRRIKKVALEAPKSRRAGDVLRFDGTDWRHTTYDYSPWWN